MNLHIAPDNIFINRFYENIVEAGLDEENKIVVRTNESGLKSIKHPIPFAPLYSSSFRALVGDPLVYRKVFIHYLTPLMYRWIATHQFRQLSWLPWGGDIYNLPGIERSCYEPLTWRHYSSRYYSVQDLLYKFKVLVTNQPFRSRAYAKVDNVLTWMKSEYQFACDRLDLNASHNFFFYENAMPYGEMDRLRSIIKTENKKPVIIIGNSASATNNHLDAVQYFEDNRISADLQLPVSYGNPGYIKFLKKKLRFNYGRIEFIDQYMAFDEYLNFLSSADGMVINAIRPQGFGNIFTMFYLGKPVFFNEKNIALPDLSRNGVEWRKLSELRSETIEPVANKAAVLKLLSHERLLTTYRKLFS